MKDDWFRRPALSEADKAEFEKRLKRSRSHRPEYMRIQALGLYEAGAYRDALALLDRLLTEEPMRYLPWLQGDRGDCFRGLGDFDAALTAYAAAMQDGKARGSPQFSFAALVLTLSREDLYKRALQYVEEFWDISPIFPWTEFAQNSFVARLKERLGLLDDAREAAQRALEAAAKTQSNARFHPELGLVTASEQNIATIGELQRIAGVGPAPAAGGEQDSQFRRALSALTLALRRLSPRRRRPTRDWRDLHNR
jgi:tetratricopeptide (TPR) repeat protein